MKSLKLLSLNIWGGRVFKKLIEYIEKQSEQTDIFCFQEVYSSQERIHTQGKSKGNSLPNDKPARANIYQELSKSLPDFNGFYYSAQDKHDFHSLVDYELSFGLASFVRKKLKITAEGEIFVFRNKNSTIHGDHSTLGKNLHFFEIKLNNRPITIVNFHGLWDKGIKTDTPYRIKQSKKIREFLDNLSTEKIICGDFNLEMNTESLKILEKDMRNLIKDYKISSTRSHFYKNDIRFADYILVTPRVIVKNFEVSDVEVSDHLPIILEFR